LANGLHFHNSRAFATGIAVAGFDRLKAISATNSRTSDPAASDGGNERRGL
jgi:hypothetical protein